MKRVQWVAVFWISIVFGEGNESCPITLQNTTQSYFEDFDKTCSQIGSDRLSCDRCVCALIEIILPKLNFENLDLDSFITFENDITVFQDCLSTFVPILKDHGMSPKTFLEIGNCIVDLEKLPDCIYGSISSKLEIEMEPKSKIDTKGFNLDGLSYCLCTRNFDPVCDQNGHWYTNECIARCNKIDISDSCPQIFESIDLKGPLILTEKDAPFIWYAGCACPQSEKHLDPRCDLDGKRYPSACYANCMGVYQIVKCDAENFNPEALMTIQAESLQQSKREDRSISLNSDNQSSIKIGKIDIDTIDEVNSIIPHNDSTLPKNSDIFERDIEDLQIDDNLRQEDEISSSIVSISETEYKTSDSKDDLYDKVIEAPLTENSERFTNEMNNIMNSKEIQTEERITIDRCNRKCQQDAIVCDLDGEEYASVCHAHCAGILIENVRQCQSTDDNDSSERKSPSRNVFWTNIFLLITMIASVF